MSGAAVERAAEQANALSFIRTFPQGLDTLVGERGVLLSGKPNDGRRSWIKWQLQPAVAWFGFETLSAC